VFTSRELLLLLLLLDPRDERVPRIGQKVQNRITVVVEASQIPKRIGDAPRPRLGAVSLLQPLFQQQLRRAVIFLLLSLLCVPKQVVRENVRQAVRRMATATTPTTNGVFALRNLQGVGVVVVRGGRRHELAGGLQLLENGELLRILVLTQPRLRQNHQDAAATGATKELVDDSQACHVRYGFV